MPHTDVVLLSVCVVGYAGERQWNIYHTYSCICTPDIDVMLLIVCAVKIRRRSRIYCMLQARTPDIDVM